MNTLADQPVYPAFSFTIQPSLGGTCTIFRPDAATIEKTKSLAKEIFVEAFATTYTEYHQKSSSSDTIEKWLRLKEGLTLKLWLSNTFDGEYDEYKAGKKGFVYLINSNKNIIGWLSHSPVSPTGELYLSQCSLEAGSRNKHLASLSFAVAVQEHAQKMFPNVKEVKLIARKINERAHWLYTKAGFTKDEKIDPHVYGESYDERYVGYRKTLFNNER